MIDIRINSHDAPQDSEFADFLRAVKEKIGGQVDFDISISISEDTPPKLRRRMETLWPELRRF